MTLAQVNTAIEAILTGGQSVSVDGVAYTAASLGTLQALRDRMQQETARANTRPLMRAFGFSSMGYTGSDGTAADDVVRTVLPS